MTDAELFARLTPVQAVALTLWGEARGESLSGKAAVGSVIRNRHADPRWPDTYPAVCFQPKQFSCWNASHDPNAQAVRLMAAQLLEGGPPEPVLAECLWLANGIIQGLVGDETRGSNHYLTEPLYRLIPPKWATTMTYMTRIGGHVFLKG